MNSLSRARVTLAGAMPVSGGDGSQAAASWGMSGKQIIKYRKLSATGRWRRCWALVTGIPEIWLKTSNTTSAEFRVLGRGQGKQLVLQESEMWGCWAGEWGSLGQSELIGSTLNSDYILSASPTPLHCTCLANSRARELRKNAGRK